jgi:very-short-patch-repair endonuclease
MSKVDWEHPERRNGRMRYPVTCTNLVDGQPCGNTRWLTKYDAKRAGDCFHCSQVKKAKLGYKATVAKHGADSALTHVQKHLLRHPSKGELAVMQALADGGHQYERETMFTRDDGRKYLLDFLVYGKYVIEFNGGCHINHVERDLYKFNAIRSAGHHLLVLVERDLPNLDSILGEFLTNAIRTPATQDIPF